MVEPRKVTEGPAADGATPGTARGGARPEVTLLRVMPSAVMALDVNGRITTLNAAAERLLGRPAEEAVGRLYPEVLGPSLSDRILRLFLRAVSARDPGAPRTVEATLPDGRRARLRATAGPLLGADGRVQGVLIVAEEHGADAPASLPASPREERLQAALRRYVGEEIAGLVDARPSFVNIGGRRQVVSVLHADVRGYTSVAERTNPEDLARLLVRYHGVAFHALRAAGATVDRFVGDAVLALWNAPAPQADHARLALRGALALRDALAGAGSEIGYGIGVHTGEAVVGNLGSEEYMHYTALGDTVNVAARLQSGAKAGEIVCSAAVLEAAQLGVRATPLGALAVKGRTAPIDAYLIETCAPAPSTATA